VDLKLPCAPKMWDWDYERFGVGECNTRGICVHCASESASADEAEPPLRLRGRILQLMLDCALCILMKAADSLN
jgi:hypothetical protein